MLGVIENIYEGWIGYAEGYRNMCIVNTESKNEVYVVCVWHQKISLLGQVGCGGLKLRISQYDYEESIERWWKPQSLAKWLQYIQIILEFYFSDTILSIFRPILLCFWTKKFIGMNFRLGSSLYIILVGACTLYQNNIESWGRVQDFRSYWVNNL